MAYGYNAQGNVVYYPDSDYAPGGNALATKDITGALIPMDPSDPRYASARKMDDNGLWAMLYGNPGTGKKYDATGRIVNTTLGQKLSTGMENTIRWGLEGTAIGAGAALAGGALAGAYGGAAAGGGGAAAAGSGAGALPAGWAPVAMGSGGAWGGAGAAGGAAAALPAGWAPVEMGSGGAWAGAGGAGSTASTVGETLAKKAAQTAAQKAAKKWMTAGAVVAPAVAGLYAATRGGSGQPTDINNALTSLLQQQQEQMQQEQPLRRLLLSQQAGMLPSYMKADPGYQQWLQNSAPAAQSAMNAVARPRFS